MCAFTAVAIQRSGIGSPEGDSMRRCSRWCPCLTHAGVRTIKGDLIGDESFLEALVHGAGWMWEDMETPTAARFQR